MHDKGKPTIVPIIIIINIISVFSHVSNTSLKILDTLFLKQKQKQNWAPGWVAQ